MTAGASSFSLSRIGQIAVPVRNLPRAVAFYRDVLGMRLLFEAPPKMAFFDCSGIRLMLSLPDTVEYDHPASIIYYLVPDIHIATRELKTRGVAFEGEPHIVAKLPHAEVWMAFFRDVDRNILALTSEAPVARG